LDLIAISGIKRDPMAYITTFGKLAFELGIKLALAFLLLAIFDYMYQRWEYEKKLMMTHQEVKEDYKLTEGDPLVKYRLRQRARQIAMTRMLREVPRADVVITNPLEVAVALRYDEGEMPAPTVVAKGKGRIAERIRDLAKEFDVMIYPDPPLARSLYAACEVGDLIPYELYRAIAEVLAYVYSMEGRRVKRA
jgi:flagellar biosynthetic protein FlhB